MNAHTAARPSPLQRAIQIALVGSAALLAQPSAQALEAVWLGGTGNWENDLAWSTLAAPNDSLIDVLVGNSGPNTPSLLTLASTRSIGRLTINSGDKLSIASGAALYLYGGVINNSGRLDLAGGSSGYATLYLGADTTFSGSGQTILSSSNSGYSGYLRNNGHTLTIAADHTVRGNGYLGDGSGGIVNKGLVMAEGSSPLYIQMGSSSGQTFDNSHGVVQIADGAALNLSGTLSGGSIRSQGLAKLGGGSFEATVLTGNFSSSGSTNIKNLTIANSFTVAGGTSLYTSGTITNQGSLNLTGGNSGYSYVYLGADTTLSGSGQTILSSSNSGYSGYLSNNGHTLTIASDHTVRGNGYLGDGSGGIVNKGLVMAEGSSPLYIQMGSSSGQTFDNSHGVVQIADGAALNLSGTLSGGSIRSQGLAKLGGGSFEAAVLTGNFSSSGYTNIKNLTIANSFTVAGGTSLYTSGTITNQGSLNLTGGNSGYSYVYLGADTTLSGSGQTILSSSNSGYSGYLSNNGHTLTIAADHTVRGNSYLGDGSGGIVNKGLVMAEGSSPLYIQMGSGSGQTFDNSHGVVQIADGAALNLSGILSGGRLEGTGSANLHGGSYQDLSLAGSLQVKSGNSATVSGAINNVGTLNLSGGNSGYSYVYLGADTTLSGSGQTILSSSNSGYSGYLSNNGHTLTIAADHTVRGAGYLGDGSGGIVNKGLVMAEGSSPLYIQVGSSSGRTFDNSHGVVQIADGAALNLSGTLSDGSIQGLGLAKLGGGSLEAAVLTGNFSSSGSINIKNLTIANSFTVASGTSLYTSGTITNQGSLNLTGGNSGYSYVYLGADTTLSGSGQTILSSSSSGYSGYIRNNGHMLTIAADHAVRGVGYLGDGSGTIVNQGLISADAGTLYVQGTQFDNSQGRLHIGSDAQMTVYSPLTLADPSLLAFDIAALSKPASPLQGLQAGSVHGRLNLSGNAVYDGQVKLDFSDYQAQLGDHFTLINTSGSFSGGFDSAWGVGNGLNYGLTIQYGAHDVSFTVSSISAVPEPSSWALLLAGLGLLAYVGRRRLPTRA
ncbi:hypothetical protein HNP55_004423 [Paucibacter oligotrophus]|uniref:Ice-binding protein C-terminal domain-containing protein n=1 Tax=Roseateles oligotrophus TaxID=1769250 RepID=A0A840LIR4_9BURK|nr:PEP-CTERM sorting domain-containing protein [Roseateles oligotrophus]MBB4845869.1 hypothetical protein [Roseateles oligotrophus]